ncbi:MAG TPA: hypothetical protein VHR45_09220 [Thermoanaerobaculia bacterium]|nr:hypothetical protein [Thermoanaerobaculia bacterium]
MIFAPAANGQGAPQPSAEPQHAAPQAAAPGCGVHCGTERWSLKTLTDGDAGIFTSAHAVDTSVPQLIAQPAPAKLPPTSRVPFEKTLVKVRALLIGWKVESGPGKDRDFHIVIADPQDKTKQMIVEVPSPTCKGVCSSTFLSHFTQNQSLVLKTLGQPLPNFQPLAKPWLVEITGPAFFDFDHGQIGLAPNCIEIHPVITIQFLSQTTSPVHANSATDLPHTCGTP